MSFSGSGMLGSDNTTATARSSANGELTFEVTGQPTSVPISVSITDAPGLFISVELGSAKGSLGRITQDCNGRQGSLPSGPRNPGFYTVTVRAEGIADNSNGRPCSISVTSYSYEVRVVVVASPGAASGFHWVNPNGGDFSTANNWNGMAVPGANDTAIFDLPGTNLVTVQASNNVVGSLEMDRGMNLGLSGSLRSNLMTIHGGAFFNLGPGATFFTEGGGFDVVNDTSAVTLNGSGTRWTSSNGVLIGGSGPFESGPGAVEISMGAVLDAQTSIVLGDENGISGTLRASGGGRAQTPLFAVNAGQLFITGGGSMQVTDGTVLQGSIEVSGQGVSSSRLDVVHNLSIGNLATGGPINGPGSLLIADGATVRAPRVFVGDTTGSNFETLTISGVGASGNASSLITTGESATLTVLGAAASQGTVVEVKDGGFLSTSNVDSIGSLELIGRVLVHGRSGIQPSTWAATSNISIGSRGTPSELVVQDGGRVTLSERVEVGEEAREVGRIIVSGGDSSFSTGTITLGEKGDGELKFSDGVQAVSTN